MGIVFKVFDRMVESTNPATENPEGEK